MTLDQYWEAQWLIDEMHDFIYHDPAARYESIPDSYEDALDYLLMLQKPFIEWRGIDWARQ